MCVCVYCVTGQSISCSGLGPELVVIALLSTHQYKVEWYQLSPNSSLLLKYV